MRETVIPAKRNERAQLELATPIGFIFDNHRILALHHEDALLDRYASSLICPDRKRIHAKLAQVNVTLGMHRARIQICRQLKSLAANDQRFFQFRQQQIAHGGWFRRGHKQTVIAPRIGSRDRR